MCECLLLVFVVVVFLMLLMVLFFSPQARADSAPAASQAGDAGSWRFRVYLDDQEIGYHHFHLAGNGEHRQLRSEARFEYRLLFLKLFSVTSPEHFVCQIAPPALLARLPVHVFWKNVARPQSSMKSPPPFFAVLNSIDEL